MHYLALSHLLREKIIKPQCFHDNASDSINDYGSKAQPKFFLKLLEIRQITDQ